MGQDKLVIDCNDAWEKMFHSELTRFSDRTRAINNLDNDKIISISLNKYKF